MKIKQGIGSFLCSSLGNLVMALSQKKQPHHPKKILLIKLGALGDVMMTTPLVGALRKEFPFAQIHYAVGKGCAPTLAHNPTLDKVIPFDEEIFLKKRLGQFFGLSGMLSRNKYDVVFVLDKHWVFGLFASFIGGYRVGFDRFGEGALHHLKVPYLNYTTSKKSKHDVRYFLDLLSAFTRKKYNDTTLKIYPTNAEKKRVKTFLVSEKISTKKLVCLCIGGARNNAVGDEDFRRWPLDRFSKLASKLLKSGCSVVLVGGNEDEELSQKLMEDLCFPKGLVSSVGRFNVRESAEMLRHAKAVVCNDSGPMHLASAVNKHIVSLFGPTSPYEKAPLHKTSVFLWKEKQQAYDIYGKCHAKENLLEKISVSDVFSAIKKYI